MVMPILREIMPQSFTLSQLAKNLGVELRGDPNCVIHGISGLSIAQPGQITFFNDSKYRTTLASTKASAVVMKESDFERCPTNALISDDPYLTYAKLSKFFNTAFKPRAGVHSRASIADSAKIGADVSIAANVVIGENVLIGARSVIRPGCVIEDNVSLGEDCLLHPNVCVNEGVKIGSRVILHGGAVIGSDGFGNAHSKQKTWVKIYQLGTVIIGDDVEIGANTCVDRGALEDTIIEDGVRLDNLIQVGHNVHIGAHTAIAGCSAIAGSAKIGRYCMIGGSAAINGHISICDGVVIMGGSRVMKSVTQAGAYCSTSFPEMPASDWLRLVARVMKIESISDRLKLLEKGRTDEH